MLKNNTSIVDDRGYNQGFKDSLSLRKRMERRADWILAEIGDHQNKTVLEIGCGTGYISNYLSIKCKMMIIGSDLCKPFIEQARNEYKRSNLSFEELDFNDAAKNINRKFDFIVGNGILHHLYYNLDDSLETFKKILNPNGKIVFIEPNIYNPYVAAIFKNQILRSWARLEPDEMAFSKRFIQEKLQTFDFTNIKIEYKDFLLPNAPEFLISPSILIGNFLEKTPLKIISQSILISANVT